MNEYIYFSEIFLRALGISELGVKWSDTIRFILIGITAVAFYMTGVFELFTIENDFDRFAENFGMLLFGFIGLVKYWTLIFCRKRMSDLRNLVKSDHIRGQELESDQHVIDHYDQIGLKFCKTYRWIFAAAALGVLLQTTPDAILGHGLKLPFAAVYPFSLNSTAAFAFAAFHQSISTYIWVLIYMAFDAWFIFLIYHACGNFCMLQNLLEKITNADQQQPLQIHERIVKCVQLHQKIYEFSDEIEDVFNIPNLIQFLVSSVAICISGYEVVTMGSERPRLLVKHLSSVYLQIAQLFIFNWCGQLMEEKSLGVSHAISRSNLYKLEIYHQRDLDFILLRAQKPSYVTAGKFTNLSLLNFTNLMSTSMSYFTMLTSVQES